MKFNYIYGHRIYLNENIYINVDGIQFENTNEFYPDIRSVEIYIDDQTYTYYNDDRIKIIIKNYLYSQDNVNLINLISNIIVNKNWFECYSDGSSGNVPGSRHLKIKPELLDEKSNIIVKELYKTNTLLENECKYENEFPMYPIWHINGKHKLNTRYCSLYCHYDIMLHILSIRFVEIKSQILSLLITKFHLI